MSFLLRTPAIVLSAWLAATTAAAQSINVSTTIDGVHSGLSGPLTIDAAVTPTLYLLNGATLTGGITAVTIGDQQSGALSLTGASTLTNSGNVLIGNFDTGSGTASIAGNSVWNAGGNLFVGVGGRGALNIASGGTVSNSNGYIGFGIGSGGGSVVVGGAGSTWNNNRLFVGGNNTGAGANGSLTVTGGGTVNVSQTLKIWSLGTVTLGPGGSIVARSFDRTSGTFAFSGGTLTVSGGVYSQPTGSLSIAGAGVPVLRLTQGATIAGVQQTLVGGTGGNGSLSIESGSTFDLAGNSMLVGVAPATSGTVTVRDSGSQLLGQMLQLGSPGRGTLQVLDGGSVLLSSALDIGAGGIGAVTVSGAGSHVAVDVTTYVADGAAGTLEIRNGADLSSLRMHIGAQFGVTGTAIVSGPNATLNVTTSLDVGSGGTGHLSVLDAGNVNASRLNIGAGEGSVGTATVGGAGSQLNVSGFLFVGAQSRGQLNVLDGAKVAADSLISVGGGGNFSGTLLVSGADSEVTTAGQLRIGDATAGTLTILAGGKVAASRATIGGQYVQKLRNAAVDGTGSLLAVTNTLAVGGGDLGMLDVRNHARVTAGQLLIADNADATGTLTVSGVGSNVTVTGNLAVGNRSRGTLNVLDGGTVSNQNGFIAAFGSPYPGIANVAGTGSVWTMTGGLYVGGNATGSGGNGTLNIGSGGTVNVAGLTKIWSAGTIHIASGGTLHTGTFEIVNGGTFLVDAGGTFDGSLQTSGSFTLNGDLTGDVAVTGSNANVAVNGNVTGNVVVQSTNATVQVTSTATVVGSVTLDAAGATLVNNGTVVGDISTAAATTLGGSGVVDGNIAGAGLVSPGNSPGILTVVQVDPTSGMDFLFQFTVANAPPDYTQPTNSLNDVLHLTHGTSPFLAALTPSNTVTIDFQVAALSDGDTFLGAFFTNQSGTDFVGDGSVSGADFEFLLNGVGLDPGHWQVTVTSISQTGVNFGGGPLDGRVTKFVVTDVSTVPEPGSLILCGTAAAGYYYRRRRQKGATAASIS